ncbi:MAG TPA: NADH-quinone oxidoreductase subunit J [Actinomycetota bacterium]|nr:NADH-quinone oxidoreductase subunit J [Actinomycetota bacterium]
MTLFVVFGALALGAALGMVFSRNSVHGALLLVVNLGAIAGLFLTLEAEFLFVAQIIVYAGAIMVLFLFVIMLLGVDRSEPLMEPRPLQRRQLTFAVLIAIPLIAGLSATFAIPALTASPGALPENFGSPEALGQKLFRDYLLPFEVTALLLLVAAIGILLLARRRSER